LALSVCGGHGNNPKILVENEQEKYCELRKSNNFEDEDSVVRDVQFEDASFFRTVQHEEEEPAICYRSYSFLIFGTDANKDLSVKQQRQRYTMYPSLMESLRNFFPYVISHDNFWLKYSLVRDGASLSSLLSTLRVHPRTLVAIETTDGEVFGSFTSAPWRRNGQVYFGRGESFLWRLRHRSRYGEGSRSQVEVYPFTGANTLEQLCNDDRIAVGGEPVDFSSPSGPQLAESASTAGLLMGVHGIELEPSLCHGSSAGTATYNNPSLTRNPNGKFTVANLEVWTTTPCYTEDAAVQMEQRKLFMQGASFNSSSISDVHTNVGSSLVCRDLASLSAHD